jgi:cation transport regulator ChaB
VPYSSNDELPPAVKKRYSDRCRSVFRRVFNATVDRGDSEERAFQNAHAAAGQCKRST